MSSPAQTSARPAAVAGSFYPADPAALREEIARCFAEARPSTPGPAGRPPKMLVVPHAGTVYSGPVAGSAYATLAAAAGRTALRRVVPLGPAHRVPVLGLAAPAAARFDTPLGPIRIDPDAVAQVAELPQVVRSDRAHEWEHSLELQLPFLQQLLGEHFQLVPLVVGDATPDEVAEVLERLWGGDETLIVVSTDLSHFEAYESARLHDRDTVERMLAGDATLDPHDACGAHALNGALPVARRHGLRPRLLDLRNSGDTAGDRRRVVGYAALAFDLPPDGPEEASADEVQRAAESDSAAGSPSLGRAALAVARNAIAAALGEPLVDEPPHPALDQPGACFVTLHTADGELRGCIGRLEPEGTLRAQLSANARAAAFRDPRFPPLQRHEWAGMAVEVSLLGPLSGIDAPPGGMTEAEAAAALRPGVDGVVLSWRGHQGTFLPQVWEQLPEPAGFLSALKRKAGLAPDFWAPDVRLQRYTVHHHETRV
ncbi:MAG: AmmeMemoRadiSam system protein B [Burkholderiales bacterium]|nr:AmmeMemoRadiSam system protein B [Burkholderiales bacterium]